MIVDHPSFVWVRTLSLHKHLPCAHCGPAICLGAYIVTAYKHLPRANRGPVICLGAYIATAYKHLPRAQCGPIICLGAQAPQRGRLLNARVSARCHEPGSDAEERSRHGGGAPPQKKTEAKESLQEETGRRSRTPRTRGQDQVP